MRQRITSYGVKISFSRLFPFLAHFRCQIRRILASCIACTAGKHFRPLRIRARYAGVSRSIDDTETPSVRAACSVSRGITYPTLDTLRQHLFARLTGSTVSIIAAASATEQRKNVRGNDSCHIHRQAGSSLANRNTPLFLPAPLCAVPDTLLCSQECYKRHTMPTCHLTVNTFSLPDRLPRVTLDFHHSALASCASRPSTNYVALFFLVLSFVSPLVSTFLMVAKFINLFVQRR